MKLLPGTCHDGGGGCQAERAGAGDHEHGNAKEHGKQVVGVPLRPPAVRICALHARYAPERGIHYHNCSMIWIFGINKCRMSTNTNGILDNKRRLASRAR